MLVWGYIWTQIYDKGRVNHPSPSMEASQKKDCFIKELSISPNKFIVDTKQVEIKEIWAEHENDILFVIPIIPGVVEFPIFTKKDRFILHVIFDDRSPKPLGWSLDFVLDNRSYSFSDNQYKIITLIDSMEWNKLLVEISETKLNRALLSSKEVAANGKLQLTITNP